VASYHVKQSTDPSLLLVQNEDLKRWLLLEDEMLMRAAAVAVGQADLDSLLAHYKAAEEWVAAARVARAISAVSAARTDCVKHASAALALLEQAGSESIEAQQLELDIRGSLQYTMPTGGPEKKQNGARMQALMAQNKSLQADSLGLYLVLVFPRLFAMFGVHPKLWDAGKIATQDTVREGFRLQINEGMALYTTATEECVGARKECIRIAYELVSGCILFMSYRSTDETAGMHQQLLGAKWGDDGSILVAACMDYRFDRHFMIAQGIGFRMDLCLYHPHAQGAAEYSGNVQQMVQLFEKQQGDMRDFVKRGVPGLELPYYCLCTAFSLTGSDFKALHPFGKDLLTLFGSCEGQCTDPSDCEEWYESADFSVLVAKYPSGYSSKDGLHHLLLKSYIVSTNQATLSLSLASMGTSNFDLSWLGSLPAPDDPTLHDGLAYHRFTNLRVLIAEVLEWQGRYKEAIRCTNSHSSILRSSTHAHLFTSPFLFNRSYAVAELQDQFNFNASSKVRAGRVIGRCHAALGEHTLSVSAFDAAIELARRGRFLLSEALTIRDRALAGQGAGGSNGLHWDKSTGKQQLVEIMGRMQGPREPMDMLLGLHLVAQQREANTNAEVPC
jgi:hypothetical protein